MNERPTHPIRRARFQAAEDNHLMDVVFRLGTDSWTKIVAEIPGRRPRQCRERQSAGLNIIELRWRIGFLSSVSLWAMAVKILDIAQLLILHNVSLESSDN
jgi:hypothetical protein